MEIILKENVAGLGYKNDIVTVKNGYGRNYLIPAGKAVIASASAKKQLAETLKQQAHKLEKIKQEALALAEKINALETFRIEAKVSTNTSIYGSVGALKLAEELKARGFEIDRRSIAVKDAKALGTYTASVKLHREVSAEITFEVYAEGHEVTPEAAPAIEETPAVEEAPVAEEAPAEA